MRLGIMRQKRVFGYVVVLGIGLIVGMSHTVFAKSKDVPCSVRVMFQDDDVGVATLYVLSTQIKNTAPRAISGVSLLLFDDAGKSMGNSNAHCGEDANGLGGGDTGQCAKVLQTISGKMMKKLGHEIWVKTVNDQLAQLKNIAQCQMVGVNYID
ncbi:hypothetical protein [Candidatus Puniceispirillum sp.]|jgi:hypothetical protein|uniref:hypothetical protein n=1 Tax=Candidatus Puniceispirillum sp. TaxID=2026719 RepID=UPI001ECDB73E|nr:hypothetical protein [Candidatus Puniceispirillum sp.]MBT6565871.1 hypothetical protein [Candidatus Puniceispirillum sp.]